MGIQLILPRMRYAIKASQVVWLTPAGTIATVGKGQAFSVFLQATSDSLPITYSFNPPNPYPLLMSLNPSTGEVSGVGIDPLQPVWVTPSGLLGTYSDETTIPTIALQATPYPGRVLLVYSVLKGDLPQGLKLDRSNGQITGTIQGVNGPYIAPVNAPTWLGGNNLGTFRNRDPITPIAVVATGISPISYSAVTDLPAGLKLNKTTGVLSGTPNISGVFVPDTDTPTWVTNAGSLGSVFNNAPFSVAISATHASGPVGYGVISGELPTGVKLNRNSGLVSGTVTSAVRTYTFTVRSFVVAAPYKFNDRVFTITVS